MAMAKWLRRDMGYGHAIRKRKADKRLRLHFDFIKIFYLMDFNFIYQFTFMKF